jgi:hypothetical protein
LSSRIVLSRKFPFFQRERLEEQLKSITAEHGTGLFGRNPKVEPEDLGTYYGYAETDSVVYSAVTNLSEVSVGQGFYLTVDKDKKALDLCNEFNQAMNLDVLLPRVVRNELIAGFLPVETAMSKFPSRCALKMIHPLTVANFEIDKASGNFLYLTQSTGKLGREIKIEAKNVTLFSHNPIGNDPRGVSIIKPVAQLISYKNDALADLKKIYDRYASPKAIWKSRGDIAPVKMAVTSTEAAEDLFFGQLNETQIEKGNLVEFLTVEPRARFWEYVQYVDILIYEGLMAPSLGYWRNATQASAETLKEVVDRNINAIRRATKRVVEASWYKPLCDLNGCGEVPKVEWGMEKTGVEKLDISAFLEKGLEIGYLSHADYVKILNTMGLRVELEEEPEPSGAATVSPEEPPQ